MNPEQFLLTDVLALAVQVVKNQGSYASVADGEKDPKNPSTSSVVECILDKREGYYKDLIKSATTNNDIMNFVHELIQFVENYSYRGFASGQPNNYVDKLKSIYQNTQITVDDIPMAVSAIGVYNRAEQREQLKELYAGSEYVGELKQRNKYFLKVIERRNMSTGYLFKCITRERNLVHFFSHKDYPVELGDCILVNATVVEHKQSKYDHDNKTTRINRVVLIENHGQPKIETGS